ncbi:hypothetical protein LJR220_002969 [Bradyrhizobium sp. LjRoot220]|uniref:hypothetical protein n=1 Tax=Bradyrhizobium sp. LjRoot220 TaxID=3342284 RepID=UPI003ECFE3A7
MTTIDIRKPAPEAETAPATPTPRRIGLRIALGVIALIELVHGLSSAPNLLGDMSEFPGPGIEGAVIKLHLAIHPVLALATLIFAAIGRVRHALIALAAMVVMTWLSYLPPVLLQGLEFSTFRTPAQIIAYPLVAASAFAFAAFAMIVFYIGVSIYGF